MSNKQLPEIVAANLEKIKHLGAAELSQLINVRASRVASETPASQTLINQFNLIEQELEEGKKAAAEGDLEAVRDAVCDIVLLALGQQGHIKNIDLDMDFKTMCAFNMTRIPGNLKEAEDTQIYYKEMGVKTQINKVEVSQGEFQETLFPVVCIDADQWDILDNHYPPRKFVKSVKFNDAEFEPVKGVKIITSNTLKGLGTLITEPMVDLFIKEISALCDTPLNNLSEDEFIAKVKESLVGKRA